MPHLTARMVNFNTCFILLTSYMSCTQLASKTLLALMILCYLLPDTRMTVDTSRVVTFIPVSHDYSHNKLANLYNL